MERSKASLGSKLAAAQEEAAHSKAELADHSSQAAKLKAQLSSITEAHAKVTHSLPVAPVAYNCLCMGLQHAIRLLLWNAAVDSL